MPDDADLDGRITHFGGRTQSQYDEIMRGESLEAAENEEPRIKLVRRMLSHTEARQLLDNDHRILFESNHKFSS